MLPGIAHKFEIEMFGYEWQTCPIRNLGSKNPIPRLADSNPRLVTSNPRLVKSNPRPRWQSHPRPKLLLGSFGFGRSLRSPLAALRGLSLNFLGGVSASGGTASLGSGWISPALGWNSPASGWNSPASGYDFSNLCFSEGRFTADITFHFLIEKRFA